MSEVEVAETHGRERVPTWPAWPWKRLVYPVVLLAIAGAFTIAGLSGSSVGMNSFNPSKPGNDPSLVAGTPRPIRSDEWMVTTPLVVGQSRHGYPRYDSDGIGKHDLSVTLDIPNHDWSTVFKPSNLVPLLGLDLDQGFAARWWMISLVLLWGAYLLLLALTDNTWLAILFSLGLWLSPFFHWWYGDGTLDVVGLAFLALGAFLYSLRSPTPWRRAGWVALAAYSSVGFAMLLYPPFQVPVALVVIAVAVGEVVSGLRGRYQPKVLIINAGATIAVVAVVLVAYVAHAHSAISAITGTLYPGLRRSVGGTISPMQLLSAPFNVAIARHGASLAGTNQSEISSFILIGPFAAIQVAFLGIRAFEARWRPVLVATTSVLVLLLAWYFIGLPSFLASLTLLDRSAPPRSIVGIGVAGFLLTALLCGASLKRPRSDEGSRVKRSLHAARIRSGAFLCAVLCFGLYLWGGKVLAANEPVLGLTSWTVAFWAALVTLAVYLLMSRRVLLGGVSLVVLGGILCLVVNPLYQGVGALTKSPIASAIAETSHPPTGGGHTWVSFDDAPINDILIASGQHTITSVSPYPDMKALEQLDPTRRYINVWDRYANVYIQPAADGAPTTFHLVQQDLLTISMDPCGSIARRLGIGYAISPSPIVDRCLALTRTVAFDGGPHYFYVVSPHRAGVGVQG